MMDAPVRWHAERLDFDRLHDDALRAGRKGICPLCEDDAFESGEPTSPRLLCWCGVCLVYHHDDYMHQVEAEPY